MRAYFKSLFSVAGLKRVFSAYVISYLGVFLSLSFLAIMFWGSVSSPQAVSGVIKESGVEKNLIFELAKKSNASAIENGKLDEQTLRLVIDEVFPEQLKSSINNEFSNAFHAWVSGSGGTFYFSYDLSSQKQQILEENDNINTQFLKDGNLVIDYNADQSSIKLRPQRAYTYFWWATLLAPILFIILALSLWFTYKSKQDLLFKIKRMLFYSSISVLLSLPITYAYWTFLANRLASYPKAGLAGALSIKPITSEIIGRMALVTILSFVIYCSSFLIIKKYLSSKGFVKVEEKHKNDVLDMAVKSTKYYLKKLK